MNTWSDDPTQPSLNPSGSFPSSGSPSGNMPPYPPQSGGIPPYGPSGGMPPYGPPPLSGGMPPFGSPPGGQPTFYRYHPALLAILAGIFFLALVILCPVSTAVGTGSMQMLFTGAYLSVFLGTIVCVLILDWRGFFSVRGLFPWQRWPVIARLPLALIALVVFPLTLGIYFIRAILGLRRPPAPLMQPVPGSSPPHRTSTRTIIGLASGLLITGCLLISSIGAAASGGVAVSPTPTPGQVAQSGHPTATPTKTHKPTATTGPTATTKPSETPTTPPTATPTVTPQPTATNTPRPQPTPTNTPAPSCPYGAVNNNPWCYNFQCCNNIYSPPSNFCNYYFSCIPSFWNGSGYVVECNDGMYSKSGGRSGACSYHGGVAQALLAP